jgi:glycine cleavage system transcriptional repressor
MPREFVLTLTGPDRIGIVEEVTGRLLERGGNVTTSRMARLGGEFAILLLVALPEGLDAGLDEAFRGLTDRGYKMTLTPAARTGAEAHPGWRPYRIEVQGADHEGIIHEVARYLAGHGISIESADSETAPAPVSGVPLFTMSAEVVVPPHLADADWQDGLEPLGGRLNVEIAASAEDRPGTPGPRPAGS